MEHKGHYSEGSFFRIEHKGHYSEGSFFRIEHKGHCSEGKGHSPRVIAPLLGLGLGMTLMHYSSEQ